MGILKRLFGRKEEEKQPEVPKKEFTPEQFNEDYELKSQALESALGKMHNLVGHAIVPFAIGGAVDMYYYPNHIKGTGFATMELLEPDGTGPLPNKLGTYELVAFTKQDYQTGDPTSPFNLIERKICGVFTTLGFYSRDAVLNPGDTCEVPDGKEGENTCILFDHYLPEKEFKIGDRHHHLLLCLQVFRNEMEYARKHGSEALFQKLKDAGYYPYSDLDRPSVVMHSV